MFNLDFLGISDLRYPATRQNRALVFFEPASVVRHFTMLISIRAMLRPRIAIGMESGFVQGRYTAVQTFQVEMIHLYLIIENVMVINVIGSHYQTSLTCDTYCT